MDKGSQADALVFFGATGDLAYKQIFPALQALVGRHQFDLPIVGVAKSGWDVDRLRARARESIEQHGSFDAPAFAKLSALLRYVDGDYNDGAIDGRLRKCLAGATRPLHYLAIPPSMFATVVEGLARAGCAAGARVVVE
jgi:glucose-6-phosphate 1-dehydrogenase